MKLPLRTVANVLAVLLLIALVVPFIIYAVPGVVGADHSFVVLTASMTPAIAPGDVVIVADRGAEAISEGDVITYTRGTNEVPVTHRVTAVIETADGVAFETKGDANSDPDAALVPAANVIGTVIFTIPYIGYVIQFTNTPYGFIALVLVPFGLLVANELWTLSRRRSAATADVSSESDSSDPVDANATPEKNSAGGFVVTERTLEGAFFPLIALAGYAGYVVYTIQTALTIAVAVGSAVTAVAVLVLLVGARRRSVATTHTDVTSDRPATDGGVETDSTADSSRPADTETLDLSDDSEVRT